MNVNKIILSLVVIGAVAAIAVGGTMAYFSDTETSTGNTISAGVIDISVDGQNPWNETYLEDLTDLKPGDVKYIEFTVKNEGQNPVVLRKMIDGVVTDGGLTTEPECDEANGIWTAPSTCDGGTQDDDLSKAITYEMTVTPEGGSPIVVISEDWNLGLNDVKDLWMPLGTIPAGKTLVVKQSYRLAPETTNWAQGDKITFNIELYAEQRLGAGTPTNVGIVMDNKTGDSDWYSVVDGTLAVLNRDGQNYTVNAFGLEAGQTYRLVYSNDPYSSFTEIASDSADLDGNLVLVGNNLPANLTDAKIWLLYGASGWGDNLKNLWETNLVTY